MGIEGFGDKRFEIGVKEYERHVIKQIKRIIKETTEMIVSQAKALAPVDLGNLRDSIDARYSQGGLRATVTVGANYAVYIEYGTGVYAEFGNGRKDGWTYFKNGQFYYTKGMHAQPFWFPSLDMAHKYFSREMKKLG